MNNISTDYVPLADSSKSSVGKSPADLNSQATLLPRSAWNSQVAYLRAIFKAKKALDLIEKNAGIARS
ncbi:MAG: hypothetical protein V7L31_11080 [Nostoc sp.]|uniref:hypothetical protein n=1 Tax=Nostoc sp. TaxID=1180 RepID=UPI002FF43CAF